MVRVVTNRYQRVHGKKPRGTGQWMFTSNEYGDIDFNDDTTFFQAPVSLPLAKAAAHAKRWGKENGHTAIYVAEEGLNEIHYGTEDEWKAKVKKTADAARKGMTKNHEKRKAAMGEDKKPLGGKFKVGQRVLPSKSSQKVMTITGFDRVKYMGKMKTFADGKDDQGRNMRRPLSTLVAINESKQLTEGVLDEMDDDGFMAKRQLYDLAKYSIQLHKMIQDSDNLEPWVQAKITKAADYIDTVKHYLEYQDVRSDEAHADFGDIDDLAPAVDAMAPDMPVEQEMMEFQDEGFSGDDLLQHAVLRGIVGPDAVHDPAMQGVADDTAEWYFADAEEIGSSDISIALKSFARDCVAQGCNLNGANAERYVTEVKAANIYSQMMKPLKGK